MTDMPSPLILLIGALAVARITALIVMDGITEPIRDRIWQWSPPREEPGQEIYTHRILGEVDGEPLYGYRKPGFLGRLVDCHHCAGVWVAAGIIAAYLLAPEPTTAVAALFALAQASDILIKVGR